MNELGIKIMSTVSSVLGSVKVLPNPKFHSGREDALGSDRRKSDQEWRKKYEIADCITKIEISGNIYPFGTVK